jgi:hypothetical protein
MYRTASAMYYIGALRATDDDRDFRCRRIILDLIEPLFAVY